MVNICSKALVLSLILIDLLFTVVLHVCVGLVFVPRFGMQYLKILVLQLSFRGKKSYL